MITVNTLTELRYRVAQEMNSLFSGTVRYAESVNLKDKYNVSVIMKERTHQLTNGTKTSKLFILVLRDIKNKKKVLTLKTYDRKGTVALETIDATIRAIGCGDRTTAHDEYDTWPRRFPLEMTYEQDPVNPEEMLKGVESIRGYLKHEEVNHVTYRAGNVEIIMRVAWQFHPPMRYYYTIVVDKETEIDARFDKIDPIVNKAWFLYTEWLRACSKSDHS